MIDIKSIFKYDEIADEITALLLKYYNDEKLSRSPSQSYDDFSGE